MLQSPTNGLHSTDSHWRRLAGIYVLVRGPEQGVGGPAFFFKGHDEIISKKLEKVSPPVQSNWGSGSLPGVGKPWGAGDNTDTTSHGAHNPLSSLPSTTTAQKFSAQNTLISDSTTDPPPPSALRLAPAGEGVELIR